MRRKSLTKKKPSQDNEKHITAGTAENSTEVLKNYNRITGPGVWGEGKRVLKTLTVKL